MIRPHIPDLSAIEQLPNEDIKLYAIIGAVVSLAASLQLLLVDIFHKGTGLPENLARDMFMPIDSTFIRRTMAAKAMNERLKADPKLGEWTILVERLVRVTSRSSHRNIAGHNPVLFPTPSYRSSVGGTVIEFSPLGMYVLGPETLERFFISGPKSTLDSTALISTARELIDLITDLNAFLKTL